jgi:subtilisin family serine protease
MKSVLSILVIFGIIVQSCGAFDTYYYSEGRQIPLLVDSVKVAILFDPSNPWQNIGEIRSTYPRIGSIYDSLAGPDDFQVYALSTGDGLEAFIDSLRSDSRVQTANPFYLADSGEPFMVGRTFCCKFDEDISYAAIDSINAAYGVEIIYEREYTPKQFLLSIEGYSPLGTLEMANAYYIMEGTEFSHPNFLGRVQFHDYNIYDHYWEEQWAMHRIFEASPESPRHKAFEITQGDSNIVIAVIDQGVAPHEDLPADRLTAGYDFEFMDDDPTPCDTLHYGYHGIGVAGIVGSSHNRDSSLVSDKDTGIYGVAPRCKIMPIKIGSGVFGWHPSPINSNCWLMVVTSEKIAGAIAWAWTHGADIISCSWGNVSALDVLTQEIRQAHSLGRDGKGCGLFFSSGNTGNADTAHLYPSYLPEVMSVGAIDSNDSLWHYSSYAKVDVVAPSGTSSFDQIWTLDQMGELGIIYSGGYYTCPDHDYDYDCVFSGTSAAQPVAAGTAALVLSRRPDLPADSLYKVIKFSADRNLRDTISNPPDQKYGYGMVHPLRALLSVSRGDANNSGTINILDATYLISFLYKSGPAPTPDYLMGDANCSGVVSILDVTYIQAYLYGGAPIPPICFNYGN